MYAYICMCVLKILTRKYLFVIWEIKDLQMVGKQIFEVTIYNVSINNN